MKKPIRKIDISSVAPLLVFTVLVVCVLSVLLTGADIYQKANRRDQTGYDHRTITQYLTTRVRQSDMGGVCYVGDFNDIVPQTEGNTFFFPEEGDDFSCCTRIYFHDGYLYELYALSDGTFAPEDGEPILPLNNLYYRLNGHLLEIEIEYTDNTREILYLHLRSETEADA